MKWAGIETCANNPISHWTRTNRRDAIPTIPSVTATFVLFTNYIQNRLPVSQPYPYPQWKL
jgi:hypothetical protein